MYNFFDISFNNYFWKILYNDQSCMWCIHFESRREFKFCKYFIVKEIKRIIDFDFGIDEHF